jgi:tripartite-type tricarboxylate transporter receptor subunit TctC
VGSDHITHAKCGLTSLSTRHGAVGPAAREHNESCITPAARRGNHRPTQFTNQIGEEERAMRLQSTSARVPGCATAAVLLLGACAAEVHAQASAGQAWPAKPIRMILPVQPGGNSDVLMRLLMPRMSESLGQPIVLEFRGGAGGTIGAEAVARAPADGYTLLFTAASHVINPAMVKKLPYDPIRDFTPISLVADIPTALVVHPSVPVKSVTDLVALAKKRPGQLNYSTSGVGTVGHLAAEILASMSGIRFTHVPYKGAGPAIAALVGGHVDLQFASIPAVIEHVRSGRLRLVGQTGSTRSSAAPNTPTMEEAGLAGFVVQSGFGILGPAGLPRPLVDRHFRAVRAALDDPNTRRLMIEQGADPVGLTPEEYDQYNRTEIARWIKVARAANIQPE